jgi:hypothetical protein
VSVVVSIHQPNFLPWLGYFDKILSSDIHVVLDDVQIPKTGGSWSNRVQIAIKGQPRWLTVPLRKEHGRIYSVAEMVPLGNWTTEIAGRLEAAYRESRFFDDVFPKIEDLLTQVQESLFDFNCSANRWFASLLSEPLPKFVLSSELGVATKGTERIRDLVKSVGGDVYLSGTGSGGYLDTMILERAGISTRYFQPRTLKYEQLGAVSFVAGLSIVDALFNVGFESTRQLVQSP